MFIDTSSIGDAADILSQALIQSAYIRQDKAGQRMASLMMRAATLRPDDPEALDAWKQEYQSLYPDDTSIGDIDGRGGGLYHAFSKLGVIDPRRAEQAQQFYYQTQMEFDSIDRLHDMYDTPEKIANRLKIMGADDESAASVSQLIYGMDDGTNQGVLDMHRAVTGLAMELGTSGLKAKIQMKAELGALKSPEGMELYTLTNDRQKAYDKWKMDYQAGIEANLIRLRSSLSNETAPGSNAVTALLTELDARKESVAEYTTLNKRMKDNNEALSQMTIGNSELKATAEKILFKSDEKDNTDAFTMANFAYAQVKSEGDPNKFRLLIEDGLHKIDPSVTNEEVERVIREGTEVYSKATNPAELTNYFSILTDSRDTLNKIQLMKPQVEQMTNSWVQMTRTGAVTAKAEGYTDLASAMGLPQALADKSGMLTKEDRELIRYVNDGEALAHDVANGEVPLTTLIHLQTVFAGAMQSSSNPQFKKAMQSQMDNLSAMVEEIDASAMPEGTPYVATQRDYQSPNLGGVIDVKSARRKAVDNELAVQKSVYAKKFVSEVYPKLEEIVNSDLPPEMKEAMLKQYIYPFKRDYISAVQNHMIEYGGVDQDEIDASFITDWLSIDLQKKDKP